MWRHRIRTNVDDDFQSKQLNSDRSVNFYLLPFAGPVVRGLCHRPDRLLHAPGDCTGRCVSHEEQREAGGSIESNRRSSAQAERSGNDLWRRRQQQWRYAG